MNNKERIKKFRCIAEDYFTGNPVSGYPVPDQDIRGVWYLCNGTGDFTIVKPETIKPEQEGDHNEQNTDQAPPY